MIDPLTNAIRKLLSGYARVFNSQNNRSGSLFRQKTKAKCLAADTDGFYTCEDYCYNCFHYIHENPVVAGLVQNPADWRWSSYNFYAGNEDNELCNMELAKKFCGYDTKEYGRKLKPDDFWNEYFG